MALWRRPGKGGANAASAAVLAVEVIGSLAMWAPIPIAWMWIGARVYDATGSSRLDRVWIALRRRAGHDQVDGALPRAVVVSATLGMLLFLVWFYVLEQAFVLPFMPSQ
jgi:hypothetical protein